MKSDNSILKFGNFIGNASVAPVSGNYLSSINPATARTLYFMPDSDEPDLQLAVDAALMAFPAWSKKSKRDKSQLLYKIAEKIEKRLDDFGIAWANQKVNSR